MQPLNLELLARVLGRMGSSNDNEVLIAARAAVRMVRESETTWSALVGSEQETRDLIGASQVVEHPERGTLAPPVGRKWIDSVLWLCQRKAGANARENHFLDQISRKLAAERGINFRAWLTPGQAAWIIDIYERATAREEQA